MSLYLYFDKENKLSGVFSSVETVKRLNVIVDPIEPFCADTIGYLRPDEDFELYRIGFKSNADTGEFWIKASSFGSAIVCAYLYMNNVYKDSFITRVTEYEITPTEYNRIEPVSESEYSLSSLTYEVLSKTTSENRDLCALALDSFGGFNTEELLGDFEIKCNTYISGNEKPFHSVEDAEIGYIKEKGSFWKNHLLAETASMMPEQIKLLRSCSESKNKEELLFWYFIFTLYGKYDCHFPYALYKRIKNDSFAPFYAKYHNVRDLLTF